MRKGELKKLIAPVTLISALMVVALFIIWRSPEIDKNKPPINANPYSDEADQAANPPLHSKDYSSPEQVLEAKSVDEWIHKNAGSMSSFSAEDEKELDSFAHKLTTSQFQRLKELALNTRQPANERILATHLLSLGEENGRMHLLDLIKAPLEAPQNPAAHSVEESVSGREKALRVMAIDQLVERAKVDASALQELKDLIPTISDPWVRSYASRRLQEIS